MEARSVGNKLVTKSKVIGGVVYSALEPSSYFGGHGSLTSVEGRTFGYVGTRRIGPEIEKLLPGSDERIEACRRFRLANALEAHALIRAAFPEETADAVEDGADLEIRTR
jgi:lactate dehydrogenase-like 2-hydroxyacid dehydrogenase